MDSSPRDWTLLTDLYQINMMYAHYKNASHLTRACFELSYRQNPCGSGYAVAAGLETAVEYIQNLQFRPADLAYLRSLNLYDEDFLRELEQFRFTGDIDAVPEGTVVFPGIPLVQVRAPIWEGQLMETALNNIIGHQTLIATKASRVVQAAHGDRVIEMGLRRAQGPDAGFYGGRAALIGGCHSTSNVLVGKVFHVPLAGTNAHSWVQFWADELEAYRAWARAFPGGVVFLVDTYDTLRSGLPSALAAAREVEKAGGKFIGIRLDSGDFSYLSKTARRMLDEAGFPEALIVCSSDLDEYLIRDLKMQGARIDVWGVGTNLIVARDCPALGQVYKLVAVEDKGEWLPRIKVSENPAKVSNPGVKKVLRVYEASGKAAGDLMILEQEDEPCGPTMTLFDPVYPWKRKTIENFRCRHLLEPIFRAGELVCQSPDLDAIRRYHHDDLETFWEEYRRLVNPEVYPVDLSPQLWSLKNDMVEAVRTRLGGDD